VGVPAQSSTLRAARPGNARDRRGVALPTAMFVMVAIAVLLAGFFVFADLNAKSVRNREQATRAVHVAEAGVNHALGLLRGSLRNRPFTRILQGADGAPGNADDELFINWAGLALGDQIPLAGQTYQGHTYFVTVADDPADTDGNPNADMNGRVRIRCRSVTTDGATAEVEAIVGAMPQPGILADGNLTLGNSNVLAGQCGGIHANGDVTSVAGGPMVTTQVSATGTVNGNYILPDNSPAPELPFQDAIPIPDLNPGTYCAGADFTMLLIGGVPNWRTGAAAPVAGTPPGWVWDAALQLFKGTGTPLLPAAGTYCVQGNAWLAGNTGSAATPKTLSIIASGSIKVDGTPYLRPDDPDNILFLAGGDIFLAGNNTTGVDNFQGMVYAGAQCIAQGNAKMFGQLVCANGAQPIGAIEYAGPGNTIQGNFSLNSDCSGTVFNKRRVLYWYPRIGT
jgi:hypothetical protein